MREEGTVLALEGGMAYVTPANRAACQGCRSGGCCGLTSTRGLKALNPIGAKVGERVLFEVEFEKLQSRFILFISFALLLLLAGVGAGYYGLSRLLRIPASLGALVGSVIALGAAWAGYKSFGPKEEPLPRIISLIKEEP